MLKRAREIISAELALTGEEAARWGGEGAWQRWALAEGGSKWIDTKASDSVRCDLGKVTCPSWAADSSSVMKGGCEAEMGWTCKNNSV